MGRFCFLFVVVLLQLFHSSLCGQHKEPESLSIIRCKKNEKDALLMFKQSFTQNPMNRQRITQDSINRLSSWVGEDCCQWYGISCDNVTHHVVKLNFRGLITYQSCFGLDCGIIGVGIPESSLNSVLDELKHLTHLDLSGNYFPGAGQYLDNIGSLRYLRYLDLSSAGRFDLCIPQLSNLTNLVHLDLRYTTFSLGCVVSNLEWASGLLKMRSLDMSGHDMSLANDTFNVLMMLPSLSALTLSNCNLINSHFSDALISNTSNSFFSTLQHLDLSYNAFEGPLPPVLKNMVSLRSLYLNYNLFNGSVPLWHRALSHLEVLDLSDNGFSYVEGGIMGIMGNPCRFKHLNLLNNFISQDDILDSFMSLSGCGAFELEYLALGNNKINGSLPSSLGELTNLSYLDLHNNRMNGSLPSSLSQLTNISYLDLHNNRMNGSLPSMLGQLINLNYLDLSHNEFKGRVPTSFVKLSLLRYLDLSYNQLSGFFPDFIGHNNQIEYIELSLNSLQGTISGFGNLSKLSYLNMNYNHLNLNLDPNFNWKPPFQLQTFNVHSCVINTVFPQWLRNQTQIIQLDLSYTGISGELPEWLWNSPTLQKLHLSGNRLTGSLPQDIACDGPYNCGILGWLDLHNNLLTGTIPKWMPNLGGYPEVIDLSSNLLSDNVSSLFNIPTLRVLDLSDNMLSGEIQLLGNISTDLELLSLRGNRFTGPIPTQLCVFGSLLVLDLAHNRLTGHIPHCLSSMPFYITPGTTGISDMSLQIEETIKGIVEVLTGTKGGQSIIDLSSNYLVGAIPKELTNISALFALNLSYNHLTGHIPENIGDLKALESLDLSNNLISGTIPQSLSSISFLSMLNLSNNNLHGPIPKGSQLQTLIDPSIYVNNSGLCGFPLPNNCTEFDAPPSSTNGKDDARKNDRFEKMWFILAIMSGVATGFWGVVGTLVIKRSWRHAYFRYVEDLADRIYVPIKVRVNKFKRRFNENS